MRNAKKKKTKTGAALARTGRTTTRTRVVALARRGGTAAAAVAAAEKHTMWALGAAGALGYASREDMLTSVPRIDALGVEGTLGAAAWVIGKMTGSKVASHVATGLLSVAIYKLASEPAA
jgi:hypothetical protein